MVMGVFPRRLEFLATWDSRYDCQGFHDDLISAFLTMGKVSLDDFRRQGASILLKDVLWVAKASWWGLDPFCGLGFKGASNGADLPFVSTLFVDIMIYFSLDSIAIATLGGWMGGVLWVFLPTESPFWVRVVPIIDGRLDDLTYLVVYSYVCLSSVQICSGLGMCQFEWIVSRVRLYFAFLNVADLLVENKMEIYLRFQTVHRMLRVYARNGEQGSWETNAPILIRMGIFIDKVWFLECFELLAWNLGFQEQKGFDAIDLGFRPCCELHCLIHGYMACVLYKGFAPGLENRWDVFQCYGFSVFNSLSLNGIINGKDSGGSSDGATSAGNIVSRYGFSLDVGDYIFDAILKDSEQCASVRETTHVGVQVTTEEGFKVNGYTNLDWSHFETLFRVMPYKVSVPVGNFSLGDYLVYLVCLMEP